MRSRAGINLLYCLAIESKGKKKGKNSGRQRNSVQLKGNNNKIRIVYYQNSIIVQILYVFIIMYFLCRILLYNLFGGIWLYVTGN